MGNFSIWIDRLRGHYQRKTGMVLFPGTLNLQLEQPWLVPAGSLRLEGAEYGGTVTVNIVPCSVLGRKAFILRTTANDEGHGHHPQTIIEIATDIKLRDAHQLKDGDWVEVEITDEANASRGSTLPAWLSSSGNTTRRSTGIAGSLAFAWLRIRC
jgi:riboflavin kinase